MFRKEVPPHKQIIWKMMFCTSSICSNKLKIIKLIQKLKMSQIYSCKNLIKMAGMGVKKIMLALTKKLEIRDIKLNSNKIKNLNGCWEIKICHIKEKLGLYSKFCSNLEIWGNLKLDSIYLW